MIWHHADVLKRLFLQASARKDKTRNVKPGRPTKTEHIEAARRRITVQELRRAKGGAV